MLLVDNRAGSKELVHPLQMRGLPVDETTLDFGDVSFVGRGHEEAPVTVGIEFKKLPELVQSIRTERLQGHQIIGMCEQYDYRWLLIEGVVRTDDRGLLLKRTGAMTWRPIEGQMTLSELLKRLHVLYLHAGVVPLWSVNRPMTVTQIEALYRTWTDVALDEHRSHLANYQPPTLIPLSQMRRTLQTLPGISLATSKAAQSVFKSIRNACMGSVEDWARLKIEDKSGKSRRLGEARAKTIVQAIGERHT